MPHEKMEDDQVPSQKKEGGNRGPVEKNGYERILSFNENPEYRILPSYAQFDSREPS